MRGVVFGWLDLRGGFQIGPLGPLRGNNLGDLVVGHGGESSQHLTEVLISKVRGQVSRACCPNTRFPVESLNSLHCSWICSWQDDGHAGTTKGFVRLQH